MAYSSRLELVVDARTGQRTLRQFEQQLDRTERSGQGLMTAMGGVGRVIGVIAAAAGGLSFSRIITETASFEDSMLGLQAVSKATTGQMQQLEKQARTLGATSMFSAKQAGDAQRFLAQAGLEVNDVLSATPGILQLATAGQMGLAQAADLASNALGGFRLDVDQLNRVNDVLAATAAGSNTSVSQLGQALSTAAPLAAAAGISIEETAAAIGVMSDAGIQAERAGTGLQGVIRQLSNVTPQAQEALAGYGLSLEQVNVETHGLSAVLETLQQANISTADAFKIFGSEAGAAAQILVNGNARVAEFTESLGDAEGEAERMSVTISSGLTGSMRGFGSMLSETLISLGKDEGIAGAFQDVTDTGTGVLAVYNDLLPEFAEANNLSETQSENIERLANGLTTTATVAGSAAGAFIAYRGAVAAATVAQWAFNTAVGANPLGAIVTVAGAAVGAMYHYREEIGLVDMAARNSTAALEANSRAIRDGGVAAIDTSYDALTLSLQEVSLQAQEAMAQLQELEARERFYAASHEGVADSVRGAIAEQNEAMADLWARQVELQGAIEENRERREALTDADRDGTDAMNTMVVTAERLSSETESLAGSTDEAAQAADTFASDLESLRQQLDPAYAAQQRLTQQTAMLTQGLQSGLLPLGDYLALWDSAAQTYIEAGQGAEDAADTVDTETDAMATLWERRLERMDDAGVDMWRSFLDGSENALDSFKRLALDTLAEVAHAYTTRPLMASFGLSTDGGRGGQSGGGFSGFPGAGNLAGRASNFLGLGSSIGAAGSAATGYAGTGFAAQAATGGYTGWAGSAAAGSAATGGGIMSGLSAAAPWLAGGMAIDQIFDLGIVEGITDAISGLFGSDTKPEFRLVTRGDESTFDFENASKGVMSEGAFGTVGFSDGGTSKLKSTFGGFDKASQFLDQIGEMDNAVASLAANGDELSAMAEAIQGVQLDAGDPSGIADQLDERWSAALEQIGGSLGEFVDGLEGSTQEIVQQAQMARDALSLMSQSAERLNLTLDTTGASAFEASARLVEMAGGMDQLAAMQSSYYDAFFTDAERATHLQDDLTQAMREMGMELPQSRDGFRELVEAQDLNTTAGRENYTALLQLAGGFDQLQQQLGSMDDTVRELDLSPVRAAYEGLQDAISNEQEILRDAHDQTTRSIRDNMGRVQDAMRDTERVAGNLQSTLDQMMGNRVIDQRGRFDASSGYLRQVLASGGLGDADQLERALSVVSQPSEDTYATLEDYKRDFLSTAHVVDQLRDRADGQLTTQERSLQALESQLSQADRQFEQEMARLDNVLATETAQLEAIFGQQSWLETINGSVLSLQGALAGLDTATEAAKQAAGGDSTSAIDQAYRDILGREADASGLAYYSNAGFSMDEIRARLRDSDEANPNRVPGFASGGLHSGGARIVGERGPELEMTGPSRIVSNANTQKLFDIEPLLREVAQLRSELRASQRAIAESSRKSARVLEREEIERRQAQEVV